MSHPPQPPHEGAPEWMVSYADMITIMMAFFVVLYATTAASGNKDKGGKAGKQPAGGKEVTYGKEPVLDAADIGREGTDERMRRVFESLYARFGPGWTFANCWVGGPNAARVAASAASEDRPGATRPGRGLGRPETLLLATPKPGDTLVPGGRVGFTGDQAALTAEQQKQLALIAKDLAGKFQRIEVRGHTTRRPLPRGSPFHDHWELAFARCRAVSEYLIAHGVDPHRIRLGVAGDNEPLNESADPLKFSQNARVEVHLLNEWTHDPSQAEAPPEIPATIGARKPE